jgi:predicted RNA polymerase sigma factor
MAQRISRAKQRLKTADLTSEAIRLTHQVHGHLAADGEVAGLLALMLLTETRRLARLGGPTGRPGPNPLAHRTPNPCGRASNWSARRSPRPRWAPTRSTRRPNVEDTDWRQILGLYQLLIQVAPGPTVTLNQAVAVGMAHGPKAGLDMLATLDADDRMARHHRLAAMRHTCWTWRATTRPPDSSTCRRRARRNAVTWKARRPYGLDGRSDESVGNYRVIHRLLADHPFGA